MVLHESSRVDKTLSLFRNGDHSAMLPTEITAQYIIFEDSLEYSKVFVGVDAFRLYLIRYFTSVLVANPVFRHRSNRQRQVGILRF